jgi:1-deoxyxylulose-5-phosphate synthase
MMYRQIGNTDLRVSEIALGTVELGLDYGVAGGNHNLKPAEADAIRLLDQAIDLGINFIDTARAYGISEELIGKVLKADATSLFSPLRLVCQAFAIDKPRH